MVLAKFSALVPPQKKTKKQSRQPVATCIYQFLHNKVKLGLFNKILIALIDLNKKQSKCLEGKSSKCFNAINLCEKRECWA